MVDDRSASAGSLPAELTSFFGRRDELRELKTLLASWRLVTIYGPGGVGKSRLEVRVANAMARSFPDGVVFVDLTPATVMQHAVDAVATALGVTQRDLDSILGRIGSKRILIILDNCEQVIEASAQLASRMLSACRNVQILATSREPLRVHGEASFAVAPLPLSSETESTSEAVDLFIARALAVDPGFDPSGDLATIAEICFRLDGLPLAIELAAATLRMLSPTEILQRLREPFRLLTGGQRTLPERQRTLRSSVQWSYELCTTDERKLWKYLSVFIGGFDITAAEAVAAAVLAGGADVVSALGSLIDKSIVTRTPAHEHTRYTMLASIRALGLEHAADDGDLVAANTVLHDWCVSFVAEAERDWFTERQFDWLDRYDSELPNMRAALEFALSEAGDPFSAFDLVIPLWRGYWFGHGRVAELEEWLSRALRVTSGSRGIRTRGLVLHAYIAGTRYGVDAAREELEEARLLSLESGDAFTIKSVEAAYGMLLPDSEEAAATLEEWYAFGLSEPTMLARTGTHVWLALLQDRLGNESRAKELQQAILDRGVQTGELFERSALLFGMGVNALARGETARAYDLSRESLRLRGGLIPSALTAYSVETIAAAAVVDGDIGRAAKYFGIADSIWVTTGVARDTVGFPTADRDAYEARARAALPTGEFDTEYRSGRALAVRQGVALVVNRDVPVVEVSKPRRRTPTVLTRRETQVAQLVASGRSNKDIAAALVISQRTAEGHVQRILTKLGLASRVQLAGWVRDNEPL